MTSGMRMPGESISPRPGDNSVYKDQSGEPRAANGGKRWERKKDDKLPEKMRMVRVPERKLGWWAI